MKRPFHINMDQVKPRFFTLVLEKKVARRDFTRMLKEAREENNEPFFRGGGVGRTMIWREASPTMPWFFIAGTIG